MAERASHERRVSSSNLLLLSARPARNRGVVIVNAKLTRTAMKALIREVVARVAYGLLGWVSTGFVNYLAYGPMNEYSHARAITRNASRHCFESWLRFWAEAGAYGRPCVAASGAHDWRGLVDIGRPIARSWQDLGLAYATVSHVVDVPGAAILTQLLQAAPVLALAAAFGSGLVRPGLVVREAERSLTAGGAAILSLLGVCPWIDLVVAALNDFHNEGFDSELAPVNVVRPAPDI